MSKVLKTTLDGTQNSLIGTGTLQKVLEKTGRLPPISILIKPLDGSPAIVLDRFLNYSFNSSILIPVDTFQFNFVAPDDELPMNARIKEGDIIQLSANGVPLATGIIDQTELETDEEYGEKGTITGRDLMGQMESNDAISADSKPIWANNYNIKAAVNLLSKDTRISSDVILRDAPQGAYLFATEPGESKLSALQRFLEPLNCLAWMSPEGKIIVGRPNMAQAPMGTLILSKRQREANVTSMKAVRSSATIPNIMVPIWSGQELVTDRVSPQQRLENAAFGPNRLRKLGHRLIKTVVVSTPQATNAQGFTGVNFLTAGGGNILQAHAKREVARANHQELVVQAVVPGHYNEQGIPYMVDQVYNVTDDRGDVDEKMYLFQVGYRGGEADGQKTDLFFCKLGSIVSDVRAR